MGLDNFRGWDGMGLNWIKFDKFISKFMFGTWKDRIKFMLKFM